MIDDLKDSLVALSIVLGVDLTENESLEADFDGAAVQAFGCADQLEDCTRAVSRYEEKSKQERQ